jgi:hypothetical protein
MSQLDEVIEKLMELDEDSLKVQLSHTQMKNYGDSSRHLSIMAIAIFH